MNVTRAQVLAYRSVMQGLAGSPPDDALLDLGVQDTPAGSAAQALSARGLPERGLVTAWSFRGAPHRHRAKDLRSLAAALLPLTDADARARLGGLGPALKKAGLDAAVAVREAAEAVRDVIGPGTSKSDLSSGVTKRVNDAYSSWCRGCGSTHVNDQLLRLAALPGGALIETATPATFGPIPRWPGVPAAPKGTDRLLRAYLTLHGPATQPDAAGFLGTTGPRVGDVWPDGLAEASVDGRKAWLPEASVKALRAAKPEPFTRLLPPSDPYLQMRDRDLLVPDPKRRKALWAILGSPGAVVVDGEVAGLWRAKQAGKGRLAFSVTAFGKLSREAVEAEAVRIAGVRGAASFDIAYD